MNNVKVYPVFCGDNGEPYYRTVPSKQLICVVDDQWHTANDDNTWNEPIGPINMDNVSIDIITEKEAKELIKNHEEVTV